MLRSLRGMVQDIDDNFNETNTQVRQISAASEGVASKAHQMGLTMDEIAKGSESSAVAIQNTAASIEEVTRIAGEVQQHANRSKHSSEEMVSTLSDSRDVVHSLVEGIKGLAENNQQSLQVVGRLEVQAKEVGEIISLVGDLAAQTNLLALNASIEAARAGEHGRGFAVVAEEVRKLADESAQAVQDITELVHKIQQEVKNVVVQISEQVKVANEQSARGTEANTSIGEVAQSVNEVAAVVQNISDMIDQQMLSIKRTNEESQEVAAIAEQTSAGSAEVSTAAEQQSEDISKLSETAHTLAEQAKRLKRTIERFTI